MFEYRAVAGDVLVKRNSDTIGRSNTEKTPLKRVIRGCFYPRSRKWILLSRDDKRNVFSYNMNSWSSNVKGTSISSSEQIPFPDIVPDVQVVGGMRSVSLGPFNAAQEIWTKEKRLQNDHIDVCGSRAVHT